MGCGASKPPRNQRPAASYYNVENLIRINKVMVFSRLSCPLSWEAKDILSGSGINFSSLDLDLVPQYEETLVAQLRAKTRCNIVPQIFINGRFIGSTHDLRQLKNSGKLYELVGMQIPPCAKPAPTLCVPRKCAP